MTNRELAGMVDDIIKSTGVTKTHIARQLKVSRQQIDNLLSKQNFSINDANRILNVIGYEVTDVSIKKIEKNQ